MLGQELRVRFPLSWVLTDHGGGAFTVPPGLCWGGAHLFSSTISGSDLQLQLV